MLKIPVCLALILGLTVPSHPAMAANDIPDRPAPPVHYPLAKIAISLIHPTGRAGTGGHEITITGDGTASQTRGDAAKLVKTERKLSSDTLITLLNEFYRIHFFELADTYAVTKQVQLKGDGTVETSALKLMDTGGKRLCVRLADYEKCITIVDGQPVEAARLAESIERLFASP